MVFPEIRREELIQREVYLALLNRVSQAVDTLRMGVPGEAKRNTWDETFRPVLKDIPKDARDMRRLSRSIARIPEVLELQESRDKELHGSSQAEQLSSAQRDVLSTLEQFERDPEFLQRYWRVWEQGWGSWQAPERGEALRRAVTSEFAALKTLRKAGFDAAPTSPQEDVHYGVDIKAGSPFLLVGQVKAGRVFPEPSGEPVFTEIADLSESRDNEEEERFRQGVQKMMGQGPGTAPAIPRAPFMRIPQSVEREGHVEPVIERTTGVPRKQPLELLQRELEQKLHMTL